MKERIVVPESEMLRQREFMRLVEKLEQRPRSYHIVSMGCQMNERDSESIAGMLEQMGMAHQPVREQADLILYNTCCVRENAENKALVVTETVDEKVVKSARNLPGVTTTTATILSPYMILTSGKLVLDKAALAKIEEVFA